MCVRASLVLIIRNEAASLSSCLASIINIADEIIIVDTGSTDASREIAAQYGARIFSFPWCDDFSAARNESLRHASGDWVLWLDADEYLDDESRDKLRRLLANLPDDNAAYVMTQRSFSADGHSAMRVQQVRLFRRHPDIRWEYRVHEQLLPSLRRAGHDVRWTDIVISHTGYQDPATRAAKLQRNLRLLLLDQADRPNDPFTLFNLGLAYSEIGRFADALPLLHRSLQMSQPADSIVPKLYVALVRAHDRLGQPGQAVAACREGRVHCPDDAELLFLDGQLRRGHGDLAGAQACWQLLLPGNGNPSAHVLGSRFDDRDEGLTHLARHHLALLARDQGHGQQAEQLWREVLAEQPSFLPAELGLAELYLEQQRWPELEETADRLQDHPQAGVEAMVLRGRACLAQQDFAAARGLLEQAIAHAPEAIPPRLYLTHVLLQEGHDLPAAEQALRALVAMDSRQAGAWRNLAVLLRSQQRLPEALAVCQSGRLSCGGDGELLLLHGMLLHEVGDRVNAETCLLQLLQQEAAHSAPGQAADEQRGRERRATARHNLALLCRQQNRLADAETHWRAALAEIPGLAAAWLGLGEVCLRRGRLAEVETILARLEANTPAAEGTALLWARLQLERREYPAARQVLAGLLAQAPQAVEAQRLLTYVLLQEDRNAPAAEQALRDLLRLAPTDGEARHNLSVLLRRQGRAVTA